MPIFNFLASYLLIVYTTNLNGTRYFVLNGKQNSDNIDTTIFD